MPLSSSAIRELEALLESLEQERAQIVERISAIEKVLGKKPSQSKGNDANAVFSGLTTAIAESRVKRYHGMTMREIVSLHLRAHPGWKAGDVTKTLRAEGYTRGGATRFSHRVYNEIWRMEKDGLVIKDDSGGFRLTEGA